MSKENYYNEIFARNYERFTLIGGYYDYDKYAEDFKKIVKGKEVLELGIGTGCLAEYLLKRGFNVEGVEPSEYMIKELEKKNLPIKVYKQDAMELSTGKKYDAIFSLGAVPMVVLRKKGIFFDTYIFDKEEFTETMRRSYDHLREKGYFLGGVQSGENDNISIGDFYKNKIAIKGDTLIKTHYFKEGNRWFSQVFKEKTWPKEEYVRMMKGIGFEVIGLNKTKTWFIFKK